MHADRTELDDNFSHVEIDNRDRERDEERVRKRLREPAFFQETKTLTYAPRTSADMQRGNYQWLPGSGSDSLRMWEIPPRIVIPPLLLHCRKADRSGNNATIKGPMVPPCYDYVSGRRSA